MKTKTVIAAAFVWLILFAGAVFSTAGGPGTGGGSRLWPFGIRISLSSSFGEYRDGHIHAGLDLRTYGGGGVPCRAVGDGRIVRMRASVAGYGKAVYLLLETGETVVYAHLSELSPELESYLWQKQHEAGRYEVDVYPPPGLFNVKMGEIFCYTGKTGTQAPHLHFEVRDIRGNPVNPLSRGWKIIDDVFPVIKSVLWLPMDRCSSINNSFLPVELQLEQINESVFTARDTVILNGSMGLAAAVVDMSDRNSGRLAPYKLELSIDGNVIAAVTRERFSYEQSSEVELEYEMDRLRSSGRHFFLLFSREGETLGGRSFANNGHIVSADYGTAAGESGVHVAVIRASDRNGNTSSAHIPFRFGVGSEAAGKQISGSIKDSAIPSGLVLGNLLIIDGRSIAGFGRAQQNAYHDMRAINASCTDDHGLTAFNVEDFGKEMLVLRNDGGADSSNSYIFPVYKDSPGFFQVPGGRTFFATRSESFFSNAFVMISITAETHSNHVVSSQGLERIGKAIVLGPGSLAFDEGIMLGRYGPELTNAAASFYKWGEGKGRWMYCRTWRENDTLSTRASSPGRYAVLADHEPPQIGIPSAAVKTMRASGDKYPEITLKITDRGAGVDDGTTEIYVDNRKVIARWDIFDKKMFILLRNQNIMGQHELMVIARDRVGNESRLQTTLDYSFASE